jgi:hypothetical protein
MTAHAVGGKQRMLRGSFRVLFGVVVVACRSFEHRNA